MLSYLTFPHRPSTGVQTARSDSDYAEAGLQEESENCKRGVWHIKKKKTTRLIFCEVRNDTSIHTETCPEAKAENKSKG